MRHFEGKYEIARQALKRCSRWLLKQSKLSLSHSAGRPSVPGVRVIFRPSRAVRSSINVNLLLLIVPESRDHIWGKRFNNRAFDGELRGCRRCVWRKKVLSKLWKYRNGYVMVAPWTRIADGHDAVEILANFFKDLKISSFSSVEQKFLKLSDFDLRRKRW